VFTYNKFSTLPSWTQIVVSIGHIQCKTSECKLQGMTSSVGPKSYPDYDRVDSDKPRMYTGDPYAGMEVSIHAGDLKNHFAFIKGTRTVDDTIFATVRTDTRLINHMLEINIEDLRERQ